MDPSGWNATTANPLGDNGPTGTTTELPAMTLLSLTQTLVTITCAIISVLGNTLVVLAVVKESKLRTYTNYFVVSLACADLLVSTIVVPFSIVYQVMGRWIFGRTFCTMFTSFDIMCCTSSIINLCAISLDRYWAIVTPFKYQTRMTRNTCPLIIASVWVSSAVITLAQIPWRYMTDDSSPSDDHQCSISLDLSFRIFSSMSSFYVPLVVMLFTYSRIFSVARRQQRAMEEQQRQCKPAALPTHQRDDPAGSRRDSGIEDPRLNGDGSRNVSVSEKGRKSDGSDQGSSRLMAKTPSVRRGIQFVRRATRKLRHPLGQATELKAFKTLSIVMGVFIVNWLPFFVLYLFQGFCHSCAIPVWLDSTVLWLGYFNSVLNPFIYFFFNKQYREAFIKLLCPKRSKRKMQRKQQEILLASTVA